MDSHHHGNESGHRNIGGGIGRWVFIGFALVAAYFLFTEHRAHLLGFLPYLFLLACPLMHLFHHHGGHGHGHGGGGGGGDGNLPANGKRDADTSGGDRVDH